MLRFAVLGLAIVGLAGCGVNYDPHYNGPIRISPRQKCNPTPQSVNDPVSQVVEDRCLGVNLPRHNINKERAAMLNSAIKNRTTHD